MNSVTLKWCFPALASLILLGCNAPEPGTLVKSHADSPVPESVTTPDPVELTEAEWIEAVLESLHQDPSKEFDLETLSTPSNREFSAWTAESLIAADLGDLQGSPDISISFEDLTEGSPNLKLWFSEEFTREVLEVGGEATASAAAVETEAGIFVPVVQSSTRPISTQCRTDHGCVFVLTVNWLKNQVQGLLVLASTFEEGRWSLKLYSPADGSFKPVNRVEEYLAIIQAQQEESRKALAEKCQVDPLSDEIACLEALEIENDGLEQLVINLCTTGSAEGATLDQCSARFVQYCSNVEESAYPDVQAQVCEQMAEAGYSLEESPENDSEQGLEPQTPEDEAFSDEGEPIDPEADSEEF